MTTNDFSLLNTQYKIPAITIDFYTDSYVTLRSKQLDTARYLVVTCTEYGIPKNIPLDWKPYFRLLKPDETMVYNSSGHCQIIEDGRVLVKLSEQTLKATGNASADLQFVTPENQIYSTKNFHLIISPTSCNTKDIISSNEFDALNKMVMEEAVRVETMKNLEENVTTQETLRQSNEAVRQTNEGHRVIAEEERETDTTLAVTQANHAAASANGSASNAENAAHHASSAAEHASTATQTANTVVEVMRSLIADENIVHTSEKGISGGIATLDENGNIPSSQLPGFVDDVLDGSYDQEHDLFLDPEGTPYVPESGKIYVDTEKRITYRWSGSTFVDIGSSLALGTTSSSAFPGDRGISLEERASALETFHHNLAADNVKFDNSGTSLIGATVQAAMKELTKPATTVSSGLMSAADKSLVDNYANIYSVDAVLSASRWIGSTAPFTQTLTVEGLDSYNNCSVSLHKSASALALAEAINANIQTLLYDTNTGITVTAHGKKPTADIPILLSFGTSLNCVEVPTYLGGGNTAAEISFFPTANASGTDVQSAITTLGNAVKTNQTTNSQHIQNKSNPHTVTKAQIGLGNVDNTADSAKRVSYAATAGSAASCTGNAATATAATAATRDASGKTIHTSYFPVTGGNMSGGINMQQNIMSNVNKIIGDADGRFSAAGDQHKVYLMGGNTQVTNCGANSNMPIYALAFNATSSRLAKERIEEMPEDEAKKLLDLRVVEFDYKENFGGQKGQRGLIAEETEAIIPYLVTVPENYNETNFKEEKGIQNSLLGIDYSKAVPYLIKIVQIQQNEIDLLKTKMAEH